MRKISTQEITSKVKELCIRAACELGSDVAFALKEMRGREESPLGKEILDEIIENAQIALKEDAPMCQDTGIAVFFVEVGRDAAIDGSLDDAINEGVRQGYNEGYLGKSLQPAHYGILFYAKNSKELKFYEVRHPHKRTRSPDAKFFNL